jgi:hypothetical protein
MTVNREFGHWPENGLERGDWWAWVVRDKHGKFYGAYRDERKARAVAERITEWAKA